MVLFFSFLILFFLSHMYWSAALATLKKYNFEGRQRWEASYRTAYLLMAFGKIHSDFELEQMRIKKHL